MHELSTLQKAASRKPNTLKNFLDGIPKSALKFKNPFLLEMDHEMILKLTQKSLSLSLNYISEKNPNAELQINRGPLQTI